MTNGGSTRPSDSADQIKYRGSRDSDERSLAAVENLLTALHRFLFGAFDVPAAILLDRLFGNSQNSVSKRNHGVASSDENAKAYGGPCWLIPPVTQESANPSRFRPCHGGDPHC
jgi:hypothetical protein